MTEKKQQNITIKDKLSTFLPKEHKRWFRSPITHLSSDECERFLTDSESYLKQLIASKLNKKDATHIQKIEDLTNQHQYEIKKEKQDKKEILSKFKNYVEQHCKEFDIPSPFDTPQPIEPVIQKRFFNFCQSIEDRFLEKLKEIGITPNNEQIKVLFNKSPACCVQAGAGSGKSTTLAARVGFLNQGLDIPLNKITVLTFTKASRAEFIEKVINLINGISLTWRGIDYDVGRTVVRTFHSLAYQAHKSLGSAHRRIIFGDYTPKFIKEDGQEVDIDDLTAISPKELRRYPRDETIPKLSDEMNKVYKELYTQNSEFSRMIDDLYLHSFKSNSYYQENLNIEGIKYFDMFEGEIANIAIKDWKYGLDNQTLLTKLKNFQRSGFVTVKGSRLGYHYLLPKQDLKIFVSKEPYFYKNQYAPSDTKRKNSIQVLMNYKKKFVRFKASNTYVWVHSEKALQYLINREEFLSQSATGETLPPPTFAYQAAGEMVNTYLESDKFKPIFEQFNELSGFVYSLGEDLSSISYNILKNEFSDIPKYDLIYLKCAIIFHTELEQHLANNNLITFDRIFHEFSDPNHYALNNCNDSILQWCQHLLIDEFQDISPNIINFLNNIKRIYTNKTQNSTLMFVGDEFQSIYSWRGGSRNFIQNPDKYFPNQGLFSKPTLLNNYRSSAKVIERAQPCLEELKCNKKLKAAHPDANKMESHFYIAKEVKRNGKPSVNYDELSNHLKHEVARIGATKEKPVYILCRTHSLATGSNHAKWNALYNSLLEKGLIEKMTIHTSKGLESKSIFILGDFFYDNYNPLKNKLYKWAGIGKKYDEAQNDEALCLGYVALTRAENNIYWYLNDQKKTGLAKKYLERFPDATIPPVYS